jgi:sugar lactone lactonase YvrE
MGAVPSTTARVLVAPAVEEQRFLPEGPREVTLQGGRAALAWVNIQTAEGATTGQIHVHFWDDGSHEVYPMPGRPGFLFPTDAPDTLFVGMGKQIGLFHVPTQRWQPLAEIPDHNPRAIINDGEIAPGGRAIVFGTKDTKFQDPIAHLYLYTLDDAHLSVLAGGQTCSNGKVFAQEGAALMLYDIDTPRKMVVRYRLDLQFRTLEDQGVAVDLRALDAFPDGMDDGGGGTVIIAFYNPALVPAGRAARFRLSTGELLEEWMTPGSPRVTCPFVIDRAASPKLVLTTAVEGMPAAMRDKSPNAGCLFLAETDLKHVPAAEVVRLNGKH